MPVEVCSVPQRFNVKIIAPKRSDVNDFRRLLGLIFKDFPVIGKGDFQADILVAFCRKIGYDIDVQLYLAARKEAMDMFEGYSPETVDFLWGIRMNNNREWFMAHKSEYVRHLYEPTKALGAELFRPFVDKSGELLKVSRIYRDARLHHPQPYKESLWICIRQDVQWWAENPCLFFEINPEGVDYGFFIWKPRPAVMKEFRKTIAAEPQKFAKMIRKAEKAAGMPITAKEYKHPEKTEDQDLMRFFLWKEQIGCIRHEDFSEDTFSPELAGRVSAFFDALTPVYNYFNRFKV